MKTYRCSCGNRLFFDNSTCIQCSADVGFCPVCFEVAPLVADNTGRLTCGHESCGAPLQKCRNSTEAVCNWCIAVDDSTEEDALCDSCRLTHVIPDLSIPGHHEKWRRLEAAKRRVLYSLARFGFPIGTPENDVEPKLSFEFKADGETPVYTGHDNGVITINLNEADDVEREKARVAFGEPHRTLIGHFRHELGHYYWDVLVKGHCEDEFRALFGDERSPSYAEAKDQYYEQGPPADWPSRYISAYASMHPWEDFAETFGAYLDMMSILDTATHLSGQELHPTSAEKMLAAYQQVGMLVNELNREMGLQDLVPEVFCDAVGTRIGFIHRLAQAGLVKETSASEPEIRDSGQLLRPAMMPA